MVKGVMMVLRGGSGNGSYSRNDDDKMLGMKKIAVCVVAFVVNLVERERRWPGRWWWW